MVYGNARFEPLGVLVFQVLSWRSDKLITCITGGSRNRTMGTRYAISAERSKLR